MNIPLVDLKAQYLSIKDEISQAFNEVLERGQFILGPEVEALEKEMSFYLGTGYAVGVASGTDALHIALIACGVKPGDEVITTPFTFIATSEAIAKCGGRPVFVDIDPDTYNIDTAKIEARLTENTSVILPVHLYGQPADMEPMLSLAQRYRLKIIEDCGQALGAQYKRKRVGSLGDVGCISFFPSKVIGAYGDGGMVVTSDPEVAEMVTILRNHGGKEKYHYLMSGFNSRLDSLQASILSVKFKHIEAWIAQRREKAALYSELLREIEGVVIPYEAPYSYHNFAYYTIRLVGQKINRRKLIEYLHSRGIATAIYYPVSLHLQKVYESLGYHAGDFPESERAQEEVLSLPLYPELTEAQIATVVEAIKEFIYQ